MQKVKKVIILPYVLNSHIRIRDQQQAAGVTGAHIQFNVMTVSERTFVSK